jgi:hypothetical protein
VYCTAFGQGGCWFCEQTAMVGGNCQGPVGSLIAPGACECDPFLYQVCQ